MPLGEQPRRLTLPDVQISLDRDNIDKRIQDHYEAFKLITVSQPTDESEAKGEKSATFSPADLVDNHDLANLAEKNEIVPAKYSIGARDNPEGDMSESEKDPPKPAPNGWNSSCRPVLCSRRCVQVWVSP